MPESGLGARAFRNSGQICFGRYEAFELKKFKDFNGLTHSW